MQIQHYLEEARICYFNLFEKMQHYYQPVKVMGTDERWLHTVPSGEFSETIATMGIPFPPAAAVHRLSLKAKLLGHLSEVGGVWGTIRR